MQLLAVVVDILDESLVGGEVLVPGVGLDVVRLQLDDFLAGGGELGRVRRLLRLDLAVEERAEEAGGGVLAGGHGGSGEVLGVRSE